jgi:NAD(P)-dependent dehydrogenase (short-subunit alcohol dehydrogenase family)
MTSLAGKVALVTGASSGIGLAVARAYAAAGARVVLSDVAEPAGRTAAAEIERAGGSARFVAADVASPDACERLVRATLDGFGRLDCACNNAGIGGEQAPLAEYTLEGWDSVIRVNLSSVFYCMKHEIPAMVRAGGGSIVNMASILGAVAFRAAPAYVAAKHGVVGLTQSAAVDYADRKVRVNAVGPGFILTPLLSRLDDATTKAVAALHPLGRLGAPEEVASLVVWLSSDEASFVTGSYYPVDGGYLAR